MVRRRDLVDIGDNNYRDRASEFLLCKDCGQESGGTRGDFFMLPLEAELKCNCGGELVIVKAIRKIKIIKE
jgi:hypothetical protein